MELRLQRLLKSLLKRRVTGRPLMTMKVKFWKMCRLLKRRVTARLLMTVNRAAKSVGI